jgi:prephenate dehydrogenase
MSADVQVVAVLGAGLVGGSVAAAARAAGVPTVRLFDADPEVRARAAQLALADEVVDHLAAAVADADLVVAAVPADATPAVLEAAASSAPDDAVLTDVASLKRELTLDVESRLMVSGGRPERFLGGHPMAGSERSGPDAADAQLFQGATWVLTPTAVTSDTVLSTLSAFVRRLGARVLVLPPQHHDELVAIVSHLPQVVSSALADVAADAVEETGDAVLAVAGGGFRDSTRIAASDPALWGPILAGNRPAVVAAMDAYLSRLHDLRDALARGDDATVHAILGRASAARRRLVAKADVPEESIDLVVALDDRPGALAAATTALGQAGVNVEDVAMRHAAAGHRGVLLVRVAVSAAEPGLAALRAAGLHAHLETDQAAAGPAPGPGPGQHGGRP